MRATCLAYTLLVLLWRVLHAWVGGSVWWVAYLSDGALLLVAPAPLLLALALWRHRWLALALLLPALLVAGALFGPQMLPLRGRAPQPGERAITAMTYNVLFSNRDFAAMAAAIRSANADLVGLQEVTPRIVRTLTAELAADFPYHAEYLPKGQSGALLLSRHPIIASNTFPLPPREVALHAQVRVGAVDLHVLVVHLRPSRRFSGPLRELPAAMRAFYAERAGEVGAIAREVAATPAPLIVLCDCNMIDTAVAAERMRGFLGDSFREVGWGLGLTNPASRVPLQRIDYVWHSPDLTAIEAYVGQPGGSDHWPVVARLAMRP